MLIAAAVFLVIALAAGWYGLRERKQSGALSAAQTVRCAEVATGPTEVKGRAEPGAQPVVAPDTDTEVVYFEHTITRHWRELDRQSDGDREWRNHSETVRQETSFEPFYVADESGRALVDPAGADLDKLERLVDERRALLPEEGMGLIGKAFELMDDRHDEYLQVETDVIRGGTNLFVHGTAADIAGTVTIGKGDGHFVISTRTEEELASATRRNMLIGLGVAGVSAVAAVGFAIAGIAAA
jgi:hypothetical protein